MKPVRRVAVLCLALAAAAVPLTAEEAIEESQPAEYLLQFRASVVVGEDGNGVVSAQFPTTVEGEAVRYVLVVENGCLEGGSGPCPPQVDQIRVVLNGVVVFNDATGQHISRVPVALNEVGGEPNRILATAAGVPHSAARLAVLAVRPLPIVVGGRSVLPLATSADHVQDFLIIHNAGPADAAFRLEIFNADGTSAGLTPARPLAAHATVTIDIGEVAAELSPDWVRGPVHVRWAARGLARISTVAREFRRPPEGARSLVVGGFELALDDYGPFPLSATEASAFGF